jgi:uncharacterized protein YjbJ (UPF0337 family)
MPNNPTWNQIAGNWKQFKGEVQSRWGKLTNDDLDQIKGQYEKLAGKIQERYGLAQEEAFRQIDEWAKEFKSRIS